ncbi:MAG: hypothetical protein H6752_11375 [Candidatus Omnitrophica bacterium]|nr:hypothetical protein [Candidatus Omnitrophota bacterium]
MELRQSEGDNYKALARERLDQILSGELVDGLDNVGRQVADLLKVRDSEIERLQKSVQESHEVQTQMEAKREEQRKRVAEAAERLDDSEAATQERLQSDSEYKKQYEKTQKSDLIADQAEKKAEEAQSNREEKGKPYEDDPLFIYLWKRGYGTSRYSANPLIRFFDGKVARLCGYHDARPNYHMLLEIPERLKEHADRQREAAKAQLEKLQSMEREAAEADGIPQLQAEVDHAEEELDKIDAEIEREEKRFHDLAEKQAQYAAGEDERLRQCIDLIAAELKRDTLISLRRHAEATRGQRDDAIVVDLARLDREKDLLDEELKNHKRMYERRLERLRELEEVRRKFKQNRYDDIHSSFPNGQLVGSILGEFLRGLATSGELWTTIQRNQRYRRRGANPTFGSGGLGLPGSGNVWRMPGSSRGGGWRIPKFPGGGGFGGGGGGGFHTGGGF